MNYLDEIYLAYLEITDGIDAWVKNSLTSPRVAWPRVWELTDYAFSLLLFGQLEISINQEYEARVGFGEEATFEHRVNMIFEVSDSARGTIMDYYSLRCDLAHGRSESGLMGDEIHIPTVYEVLRAAVDF